jgi:hypothetical protein
MIIKTAEQTFLNFGLRRPMPDFFQGDNITSHRKVQFAAAMPLPYRHC